MYLPPSLNDKTQLSNSKALNLFTTDELNHIENVANKLSFVEATTQQDKQTKETRNSKVKWLYNSQELQHIYNKIAKFVITENDKNWNFDLTGMYEAIQYTVYEPDMHYTWHLDSGVLGNAPRKLSATIQLSDPDEYEGGNLEIWTGANPEIIPKEKGLIALFPSFRLHRVTPVTKGIRKSLVVWVGGPNFK